jgi:hypothetical protein
MNIDSEFTTMGLEHVLGAKQERPYSIPESEWVRVKSILGKYAAMSFKDFGFPLLEPSIPPYPTGLNKQNIQTYEDCFAMSNDPEIKLSFTDIFACTGIVLIDSATNRRMTVHVLTRLEPQRQRSLQEESSQIVSQITDYWGEQGSSPTNMKFVSPEINTSREEYQDLLIQGLKNAFPDTSVEFIESQNIVV